MAEALADDYVPVRRDVLANLQASAAMGTKVREFGNRAKEIVVTEVKAVPSTAKSMVAPIGVGAILAYVATLDSVKNSETVKKQWWLLPAALLVVGYVLKRRNSQHANAVLTAAAMLFVTAYQNRPKEEQKEATTTPKKTTTDTAGFAAAPIFHPIDDRTAWIQSGGQWVRVQLAAPVRPALPMQTAPAAAAPAPMHDPAVALAAAAFAA